MKRIAPSLLLLSWLATGPLPPGATSAAKPRVVTSLLPLYCLTKQLPATGYGGQPAGPGTDAHDFN